MKDHPSAMKPVEPIHVVHLFPEVHARLLNLLRGLTAEEWTAPTACAGWSVKDVALHLLDGDVGVLSWQRDRDRSGILPVNLSFVAALNQKNGNWVEATRQMSPRVIVDLIEHLGGQALSHWQEADPFVLDGVVSWAGPGRAPQWLDMARHYTEKWHHQQHIRDAVHKPGLKEPRYLHPVLDTFVRALPHTFRDVAAHTGTVVELDVEGDAGGSWFLLREPDLWTLWTDAAGPSTATVRLDQDVAWRMFTKGISTEEALRQCDLSGDRSLAAKVLGTVSIIA